MARAGSCASCLQGLVEGFAASGIAAYPTPPGLEVLAQLQMQWSQPRQIAPAGNRWKTIMDKTMEKLLNRPIAELTARVLLTLPFWTSGFAKLVAFDEGVAEMARAGLEPPVFFNVATIVTQLVGSAMIIARWRTWIGAGALGVFTALTILLVHRFWALAQEPFATIALHTATEHAGMIGGLLAVAVLSARSSSGNGQDRPQRSVWHP